MQNQNEFGKNRLIKRYRHLKKFVSMSKLLRKYTIKHFLNIYNQL